MTRRILLGLIIGIGVLLLVVIGIVLSQQSFWLMQASKQEYYLKTSLVYLYIRIHNTSSNIPILGNKTLIEYIAIVRVENPYENQSIELERVSVNLPEQVYVQCTENVTATVTATIGEHPVTTRAYTTFPRTQVVFDSWVNKTICAYGFTNDLLRHSAYRVFTRDDPDHWIPGNDPRFNHKYVVITGITELPQPWHYRLNNLANLQYVVIRVEAHTSKSKRAEALKIITISLAKIQPNIYVYNVLPEDTTFDLEGTPIITTFYGKPWP